MDLVISESLCKNTKHHGAATNMYSIQLAYHTSHISFAITKLKCTHTRQCNNLRGLRANVISNQKHIHRLTLFVNLKMSCIMNGNTFLANFSQKPNKKEPARQNRNVPDGRVRMPLAYLTTDANELCVFFSCYSSVDRKFVPEWLNSLWKFHLF